MNNNYIQVQFCEHHFNTFLIKCLKFCLSTFLIDQQSVWRVRVLASAIFRLVHEQNPSSIIWPTVYHVSSMTVLEDHLWLDLEC